jgi:TolB protein
MNRRKFLLAAAATPLVVAAPARAIGETIAGDLHAITDPGNGDNRANYLPDGRTLLFISNRSGKSQIWAADPDGARPRRLHESDANDYGRVAPSPDGSRLCFSSDREGENAIYILDIATGQVARISDLAFWSFGPTWSSRDLIAFFSKKGGNALNTWAVRPAGSQAHPITNRPGESRQPWWAPDGEMLALSADGGTGAFQIWLMTADGSEARPITAYGNFQQPFWSPDGRSIAVSAKIDEPRFRIYVMRSDGSDLRPIRQPGDLDNVHPAWSPDGRNIVFTSGAPVGRGRGLHPCQGCEP